MKRFYLSKLIILLALLSGSNVSVFAQSTTFSYTGSGPQYYTVPAGVTSVNIDARGASGGNSNYGYGNGGKGGRVQCNLTVTPGQVLNIYVGGTGTSGNGGYGTNFAGGYNGGGMAGYAYYGCGGGGMSDVRTAGVAFPSNAVVVAGGGGGSGGAYSSNSSNGGDGGGLTGKGGQWNNGTSCACYSPTGGTQSSPGSNGTCWGGTATQPTGGTGYYYAGGGGGGWYGGGGGYYYAGGAGGSSYPAANGGNISALSHTQGYNSGNGSVVICPGPIAGTITGSHTVCPGGSTTTLTDVTGVAGGVWTSSNASVASIGASSAIVTGILPGTTTISYTVTSACASGTAIFTVTVLPKPTVYNVTSAGSAYCLGSAGVDVGTDGSDVGTSYQLYLNGVAVVTPPPVTISGTGAPLDFGNRTVTGTGTYTVKATIVSSGCAVNLNGSAFLFSNPLPNIYTLSAGGTAYCAGPPVYHVTLNTSDAGISYELFKGGVSTGIIMAGSGTAIDFGAQPNGTYTAVATNNTTSCTSNMAGSPTISVNPLPVAYNVTSVGTSFCAGGTGVPVGLSGSTSGVSYQLYLGAMAVGLPVNGTGSAINFGLQPLAGIYTVVATNTTTLCTNNMTGSITVKINPLPNIYTVTGGGSFCATGTGLHVGLSSSDVGISYQLYLGGVPVAGAIKTGTGSSLDFGLKTSAGNYTVVATNSTTGCQNNMSGTVSIAVNPLPSVYTVSAPGGGSSFCAGGSGIHVTLSYSDIGVNYQLYIGASMVGGPVAGSGAMIDFGPQFAAGTYTVKATNITTTCTNNMAGSVVISISLPPALHMVNGGGNYCSGTSGLPVGLDGSNFGISYQLYNAGTPVGSPVSGTGSAFTFGPQTLSGNYTVIGTNLVTGCTSTMTGSTTINIKALPNPYLLTGGGGYCTGASGPDVSLTGSDLGISYQLFNGPLLVGVMSGTGSPLDFGYKTGVGTYTVKASNTLTTCSTIMPGTATISMNPQPNVYTVMGGGNYCTGGIGADVSLSYSNIGINYQLVLGGVTNIGGAVMGTGGPLDFGYQPATGNYTVVATNASTGCTKNMTGSVNVNSTALPTPYAVTVTNGGNYCAGGTGVDVGLASSNTGILYQLYNGTTLVGAAKIGTGAALDFGIKTVPGTYSVLATNAVTGCTMNMTGSITITINPLPNAYSVTGGGSYCDLGSGINVLLSNSDNGVSYQLLYKGVPVVGGNQAGNGSAVNFGLQTGVGVYTVVATDGTTGCTGNMSGSAVVATYPLPNVYTVTGGGNYCSGGSGEHVTLSGSQAGITYNLKYNGYPIGGPNSGTGGVIDLGTYMVAGNYSIVAVDNTTGCTDTMFSNAVIGINPLPDVDTVTGGGNYCSGGSGISVGLNASATTVKYQLYHGGSAIGSPILGTGSLLNFGLQTAAGTYTVKAIDVLTTCTSDMALDAKIFINPLNVPAVTISAPALTVCEGTVVNYSTTVVNGGTAPTYQWSVGGTAISGETNSTYSGTPNNLDVVSVAMTSNETCLSMPVASDAVTMSVNPTTTPSVTIMADPGNTVCKGTPVTYTAAVSNAGLAPTYSWTQGGVPVSTGIFTTLMPVNGEVISVTVTSSDPCHAVADSTAVNSMTMTVNQPTKPANVALKFTPGTQIIAGTLTTVTATYTAGSAGANPTFVWLINGIIVNGETTNTLVRDDFNDHDSVTCIVIGDGVCGGVAVSGSKSILVRTTTGINHVTGVASDIRVVPNPNKGMFSIKGSLGTSNDQEVSLEISNMLGQVVYSNHVTAHNGMINEQVKLSNTLANGMYLLNVRSGSDISVFHFVIEQ